MTKGVSTPSTFFVFTCRLPPLWLSIPLTYDVYKYSAHIHTKWLAVAQGGGGGGEYLSKTLPISIRFNDKIWLFPPKFEVFVLQYRKINL